MRGLWRELAGLVLPVECAGCGAPCTGLCEGCRKALGSGGLGRGWRVRPDPEPAGLPVVYAATEYADAARAVLLAHKERGALGLAGALGAALAGAVRSAAPDGSGPLLLVPVPSSRRAVATRGHDATRRIALAATRELRSGLRSARHRPARVAAVLRQGRVVADQSGLSARARVANLAGALVAVPGAGRLLGAAPAVLVDDLMTTGASLVAAAAAVRAAGGRVIGAAVVAAPVGAFR